ncbi:hypothetical protein C7C46_05745 [Streptomyces tateyamensis]|uniref:DUF2637 domain-containing protein n=1 Tax=Streptomyces tateyamensis TaxID=565073 RepID=A0A2V4P998_9ACTN|nr:DUF2637 domain-containing protein [Streptomyces tateyamensis]PYC86612.1 hypothetical protein C7C46_05745 [Streptomyces tateyamensis]
MPTTIRRATLPERRASAWDRIAVALLGAAGFALSYDALQQMAVAVHVRGPLTYLFPLIVDGFIAYGVRALLVLRDAYSVVGLLSTLAPLALGGSVHLYILIARHGLRPASRPVPDTAAALSEAATATASGTPGRHAASDPSAPLDQGVAVERERVRSSTATASTVEPATAQTGPSTALAAPPSGDQTDHESAGQALFGNPSPKRTGDEGDGPAEPPSPAPAGEEHARTQDSVDRGTTGHGLSGTPSPARAAKPVGRPPGASKEALADIGRQAWQRTGRLSRASVRKAVRARGVTISGDRLTDVMGILRAERNDAEQRGRR